jgi:hypothetical protein
MLLLRYYDALGECLHMHSLPNAGLCCGRALHGSGFQRWFLKNDNPFKLAFQRRAILSCCSRERAFADFRLRSVPVQGEPVRRGRSSSNDQSAPAGMAQNHAEDGRRLRRTVAHDRGQPGIARKTKGNPTKFHITSGECRWRTVQTVDLRAEVRFHPTCSGMPNCT